MPGTAAASGAAADARFAEAGGQPFGNRFATAKCAEQRRWESGDPSSDDATHTIWGIVGVITLASIVFGIYWGWGWSGLLTLALWGTICGASFGAVFCACSAWKTETETAKRWHHLSSAMVLLVVATLSFWGLGFVAISDDDAARNRADAPGQPSPVLHDEGQATWEYWHQLHQIGQELEPASPSGESPTPAELVANLRNTADRLRQAAVRIFALSPRDVDADVVALAADYQRLISDLGLVLDRFAELIESRQQLYDHAVSFEALSESFVRGFFGDPLGKTQELREIDHRLGGEFDRIQRRYEALTARNNEFRAQSHRLRGRLSNQYQRDFPPID